MNEQHKQPNYKDSSQDQMSAMIAKKVIKQTEEAVVAEEQLANRVKEATAAMEVMVNTFKREWIEWIGESKGILQDFQMWRMAMNTEAKQLLTQFGDVRKFFLSEEHLVEVQRLKEFVELMERLQKLKDTGFLDRVADTMLNLEETKKV